MSALALSILVAAASPSSQDAWPLVDKAAAIAHALPSSPVLARVREQRRKAEPLLDDDLVASLDSARAAGPALDLLDAANAAPTCTLPVTLVPAAVLDLADAALVNALLDGADKKPSRAATQVVRAADLGVLVARCARPTLLSFTLALSIGDHARAVAWHLAEQREIDVKGLARVVAALAPITQPAMMERALDGEKARVGRALTLEEQGVVQMLGKRLDDSAADQARLAAAVNDFEGIERPVFSVDIRCDAVDTAGTAAPLERRYTVSRAVAHALERRAADVLGNDSVVAPDFVNGSGLVVVDAGPVARSCGFLTGDVVLEVNGVDLRRMEQAFNEAPAQIAADRKAVFRVRRAGEIVSWTVSVDEKR
jgi:hypothetical protein